MPQDNITWITQYASYYSCNVTMVYIKFLIQCFFRNAAYHTRVVLFLTDSFPLFVFQSITQLQFFCFAITFGSWAIIFVQMVAWPTA